MVYLPTYPHIHGFTYVWIETHSPIHTAIEIHAQKVIFWENLIRLEKSRQRYAFPRISGLSDQFDQLLL